MRIELNEQTNLGLLPEYYQCSVEETATRLTVSLEKGLSVKEAKKRLEKYGNNELAEPASESIWDKIKEQFQDLLVRLLLLAALVSFVISQFEQEQDEYSVPAWVEPVVIFTILILNAAIGIYQDYGAEQAIDALRELQSVYARVLRDDEWTNIKAVHLVPGDIVQVTHGDVVPADVRVSQLITAGLRANESTLTGESESVSKHADAIDDEEQLVLAQMRNMLFSSTTIESGTATGIVVATGMNTQMGMIQNQLVGAKMEEEESPLKVKLDEFGDMLAKCIGVICIIVWLVNFRNFSDPIHGGTMLGCLYYFKVAVALAVAAIPEGLPAVITTCLALGSRRMAKEKAIIRNLHSVETLGCTTVICSDKTGTLTANQMVVREFFLFNKSPIDLFQTEVTGATRDSMGEVKQLQRGSVDEMSNLRTFCESMCLNNDSKFVATNQKSGQVGLDTEGALKVLVEKIGRYDSKFVSSGEWYDGYNKHLERQQKKIGILEFTSQRKAKSTLCRRTNETENVLYVKGAPDFLINSSKDCLLADGSKAELGEIDKKKLLDTIDELAHKKYRTLAIGVKHDSSELIDYDGPRHPSHSLLADSSNYASLEGDLTLIGVVAILDPPRPEVAKAIQECKSAGISVIMITGDNRRTAEAIGMEIGIVDEDGLSDRSFGGMDFDRLPEEQQRSILQAVGDSHNGFIFSRTTPAHKRTLVKQLLSLNQIVAMTGDGVNDAPALKQAHIGIAMGMAGTEVAKQAADMILADDNFATIVKAIEEGRAIFENMKAFIRYMISSNIGEVVSILLSSLLGIPDGFNSIQLLWVNLVTDGLPATALSFNPPDPLIMQKPPRKHDEPIVTSWVLVRYLVIGSYVGLATVGIFVYWYLSYSWATDGHSLVSYSQLSHWTECTNWEGFQVDDFDIYNFADKPCMYFTSGKVKASTLSLTVLVMIEMLNSLNALSEDASLLTVTPLANPLLLVAIATSIFLHCGILYIPFFRRVFGTASLSKEDWLLAMLFSAPVLLIDEILKWLSRRQRRMNTQHKKQK